MLVQVISAMEQRWINNVSLTPLLIAAPDDPFLELAPPHLRKRDRDKQTEQEIACVLNTSLWRNERLPFSIWIEGQKDWPRQKVIK